MKATLIPLALTLLSGAAAKSDEENPYVPYSVDCPEDSTFVRKANALGPNETNWLKGRDGVTKPALVDWLKNSNLTDFDPESFLSNDTIRLGLAFSGGGYRAMLNGAGQFAALDSRTTNSTEPGHMGGLVQAATYIAGLSGGNWLLGSLVVNNFTSVQELQASKDVWKLSKSIFAPGGINVFKTLGYWDDIIDDVEAKGDAGWNTSLTDLWGRGLSYQFFNFSHGGRSIHYSDVRNYDAFKNYEMPFPIHVADGRAPDTLIVSENSTVFEFNPFELGSWDPNLYSFTDLQYLCSYSDDGKASNCTNGYDNAGFLVGTSSTLFNQFFLQLNSTGITGPLYKLAKKLLLNLGERNDDIALYHPNPFYKMDYVDNGVTQSDTLDLVDGGEDGQNVPLHPLIQPQRDLDVVFAFDNSADTSKDSVIGGSWANGTSLVKTYERQFVPQGNGTIFPYVPDAETLLYGGYLGQPTFFGCNRDNLTSLFNKSMPDNERFYPPVIVFIPNTYMGFEANTSTFKMSYDDDERDGLINNGYNVVTQLNGTLDSEWRTCVACAIILREQQRRGESPTEQCQKCLSNYCWDGQIVSSSNATYKARRDGKNVEAILASKDSGKASSSNSSASAQASGSASSTSSKKKNAAVQIGTQGSVVAAGLVALFSWL
ncbi:Lysophospholipase 1 [Wickerhamiella sorbophila]|uniref:Lysophospholipase n=1 Tax=Wickerhamiella sorbophila TaxID=45607 RepID=A0A2T0FJ25_9ASCO|nr:Lysophospholipase 1 [Wickerhamiella sorbophila]PRT55002.1 Lysophospholipase 1 [Wickerhamiella sorbophila]